MSIFNHKSIKYARIFDKSYRRISSDLSKSKMYLDLQQEIPPLLFTLSEYSIGFVSLDRAISSEIMTHLRKKHFKSPNQENEFNKRLEFYVDILSEKKVRAEWLLGKMSFKDENYIIRCFAAFGDLLINPFCLDDYDNAPIALHDIYFLADFASIMNGNVLSELYTFVKSICGMSNIT